MTSSTKPQHPIVKILDFGCPKFQKKNFLISNIYKTQNANKIKHNNSHNGELGEDSLYIGELGEDPTKTKIKNVPIPNFGAFIANYSGKGITSFFYS